jgi:hypothetical protein
MFKLPQLPKLPHPPHLAPLIRNANPLKEIVEDGRALISDGRSRITELADAIRVEGIEPEPELPVKEVVSKPVDTPPVTSSVTSSDVTHVTPAKVTGVTDAETLQYQKESIVDELAVLEKHLAEGGKLFGGEGSCDCIAKHSRLVKKFAAESIPIAARQGKDTVVYTELADWAKEMQRIGTKEKVDSGEFADRYSVESGMASKFRKSIEGNQECVTCKPPKKLSDFLKERKGE